MERKEIATIRRKIKNLQKEIAEIGPVMRGTAVVIGTRNKQPYFSLNKDKKTHLIYLGKKKEMMAREYSDNYKELLNIIEEMTILNMTLLKNL